MPGLLALYTHMLLAVAQPTPMISPSHTSQTTVIAPKEPSRELPSDTFIPTDDDFINARTLYQKKDYTRSIEYYKKILKENPNDPELMVEVAQVLDDARRQKDVIQLLNKFIDTYPDKRDEVLPLLAWQYVDKEKRKSIALLKDYLSRHQKDIQAKKDLKLITNSLNDGERTANLDLARGLVAGQNYTRALRFYELHLAIVPTDADLMIEIGKVNDWNGNSKEAVKWFEKAYKNSPYRHDDLLRPLAWQYLNMRNPDKAEALFKAYLKNHPDDNPTKMGLKAVAEMREKMDWLIAQDYVLKNDYKNALVYYRKQYQKTPNRTDLIFQMALAADNVYQHQEAKNLLLKFIELAPQRADAVLSLLAWQCVSLNDYEGAKKYIDMYWERRGKSDNATMMEVANLYSQIKIYDKALALYNELLNRNPENIDALNGRAKMYLYMGRYIQASLEYGAILAKYPNNLTARLGMADLYQYSNKFKKALGEYHSLLSDYTQKLRAIKRDLSSPMNQETNIYDVVNEKIGQSIRDSSGAVKGIKQSIAFSQYQAGYDEIALKSLEGQDQPEALKLKNKIEGGLSDTVNVDYQYSADSDDVHTNGITASYIQRPSIESTRLYSPSYRIATVEEFGKTIVANTALFKMSDRFGTLDSPGGTFWPGGTLGVRNYGDWTTLAYALDAKWEPYDLVSFYGNVSNDVIEIIQTLEDHVQYNSATIGLDYNVYPPMTFTLEGVIGNFSEGNVRKGGATRLNYDMSYMIDTSLGAAAVFYNDSKPELNQGYYNPAQYTQATGYAKLSYIFKEGSAIGAYGEWGWYKENPGGPGTLYDISAYAQKSFGKYGALKFYYYQLQTLPYSNKVLGYGLAQVGLTYIYNLRYISRFDEPAFTFISNRGATR